jgi:hypothetical protein
MTSSQSSASAIHSNVSIRGGRPPDSSRAIADWEGGEELPIWFGVMVLAAPALVLVVAGVIGAGFARRQVRVE